MVMTAFDNEDNNEDNKDAIDLYRIVCSRCLNLPSLFDVFMSVCRQRGNLCLFGFG